MMTQKMNMMLVVAVVILEILSIYTNSNFKIIINLMRSAFWHYPAFLQALWDNSTAVR
jgi:hypothetical protein